MKLVQKNNEKKEAKKISSEKKKDRAKLKSRSDWIKEAQAVFNAWIRERDKNLPCISCKCSNAGQWHAGHYLSVGARPELRFDPLNVHKQCVHCNLYMSGNLINYRKSLCEKIGVENVELLEGPHDAKKYTIEELELIKKTYSMMLKKEALANER
jgi:hypothetical protein